VTPIKSIRAYCIGTCCAGNRRQVTICGAKDCPLFGYRLGKHPARRGATGGVKNLTTASQEASFRGDGAAKAMSGIHDCALSALAGRE